MKTKTKTNLNYGEEELKLFAVGQQGLLFAPRADLWITQVGRFK